MLYYIILIFIMINIYPSFFFFIFVNFFQFRKKVPLILVGSKCDLESEREVSRSEGQELSQKWSCPFFETSAKTQVNVQEVFTELVRIVKASKKGEANPSSSNQDGNGCCVLL